MRAMVWFRTDLRVGDNLALFNACRDATRGVVGVYVVSPGEWRAHDWAGVKVELALGCVKELSAALGRLNVALVVVRAEKPSEVAGALLKVARERSCDALYFNREYEVNEARRDARVAEAFEGDGRAVRAFDDQVFAPPGEVRTGEGRFFTVFSPFKRALYARMKDLGLPEVVGTPKKQAEMVGSASGVPESVEGFESHVPRGTWTPGETEARRRLGVFVTERIEGYKERRDFPAVEGTSALSPYLNIGAISCRECLAAAVEANPVSRAKSALDSGSEGAVHWISELVWREFYIHVTVGFPRVVMGRAFQVQTERVAWRRDAAHLEAWKAGRTGVPIVDAGMRQMLAVGWMHNRVRMITAMYLTKNLLINWQEGERFFARHLVDLLFASNNGGWQWSASTGTDAAPYFRIFNPVSQSKKFDAEGAYIRRWVPELRGIEGEAVHEPWELPGLLRTRLEYPEPLVDLGESRERAIEAFRGLK